MLTGIILAGGPNDYVNGRHKSLLPHNDKLLIHHQIKEMSEIVDELIIVTNSPRELLPHVPPNIRIITDFYLHRGVLGGLHAGLSLARSDIAWVIKADNLSPSSDSTVLLIKHLLKHDADIAIPVINNIPSPLQGVYRTDTKIVLTELIQKGASSLTAFLERIDRITVPIHSHSTVKRTDRLSFH